ncbi:hydrolase [Paludibacter jiangxiensis]|uniref:Predicted hydrolase, HD superfamily n=1 Tax=Paludibacter jiangxiensis TaxID=681398 RepID=A0A161LWW8_9BACT|nr:hydrolase [Paludibacter jiangxiensis]GAT63812.1 predicted hydrolase, HD superfamily [Paludibacter jiangxiensis]
MRIEHLPKDNAARISPIVSRNSAIKLLKQFNREEFHIQHAETVEATMRYFARILGYTQEQEFWGLVGLLHDLDFEQFPDEHCIKIQEIMEAENIDPEIERAVVSHGYGHRVNVKPEHEMEKVLYAIDELTGLIGAAILMRPSKSTLDLTVSSLKKKFKDKKFAAGCSRDVIQQGAEMLGWEFDYLIDETIKAMQEKELADKSR